MYSNLTPDHKDQFTNLTNIVKNLRLQWTGDNWACIRDGDDVYPLLIQRILFFADFRFNPWDRGPTRDQLGTN